MRYMKVDKQTQDAFSAWLTQALESARRETGKKWTDADLATELGVSRPVITKMRGGGRTILIEEVVKIARILNQPLPPWITVASERLPTHNLPLLGNISERTWRECGGGVNEMARCAPISIVVDSKYSDRPHFGLLVDDGYASGEYAVCVDYNTGDALTDKMVVVIENERPIEGLLLRKKVVRGVILTDDKPIYSIIKKLDSGDLHLEPDPTLASIENIKPVAIVVGFFRTTL